MLLNEILIEEHLPQLQKNVTIFSYATLSEALFGFVHTIRNWFLKRRAITALSLIWKKQTISTEDL